MKTIRFLTLILCFSLVVSCKKGTNQGTDNKPPSTSDINQSLLLQLVNDVRTKGCSCGATNMPPVTVIEWNDLLKKAADQHSLEMNSNKYFSHTGLNGSTPGDRISQEGYIWTWYGENIAYNYPDESTVMEGWLNSEGHCKNIMNPDFKEMGVSKEGLYWTQVFGSR